MKKFFTSPKLVSVSVVYHLVTIFIFEMIFAIPFSSLVDFVFSLIVGIIVTSVLFVPTFIINRNAFNRFYVDDVGLHTKYLSIEWKDISSYEIMEVHIYTGDINPRKKVSCPSVICIGEYDGAKSFKRQDPKKCIMFSLIKKQLDEIEKYGKGKSKTIDQILDFYK